MQTSDLRQQVRSALPEFCWSQWVQMGVSGGVTRRDRWAVDPEALLLFTLTVARRDPRLFDEVLDWLRLNGKLLSVQRLKNLARAEAEDRRLVAAALAWAGTHNPALRLWASEISPAYEGKMEVLFRTDGEGLFAGEGDDRFLARGFSRPRAEPSFKSQAPDPSAPINFVFRLRLLFGIGTRSEVVRYLLTTEHPEASTQQVTEAAGFAKRNVGESLAALAEAGALEARWRGNELVYRTDRRRWVNLLGGDIGELPDFVDWIHLFRALLAIPRWLDEDAASERSEYLRSSEARQLVDRIRPGLLAAGVPVPDERGAHGPAFWPVFVDTVEIGRAHV